MLTKMPWPKVEDEKSLEAIIQWIRKFFDDADMHVAVIGMSGGKDSTVCGAMLVRALGPQNVIGVFMPNGEQADLDDAHRAASAAGITRTETVNIATAYVGIGSQIPGFDKNRQGGINLAPHLRMSALYAVGQTLAENDCLVCCTGNLSEATVGYCTLYGDLAGDFAPIASVFKEDVCKLGKMMGLPDELVDKVPSDGLSGKSDEEKLGVSYADIRTYVLDALSLPEETRNKINALSRKSEFKRRLVNIPSWPYWG